MRHSETLTSRQRSAIDALLQCHTLSDAASQAGIARRTLHRWMHEPAFVAALDAAKREAVRHASRRLAGALNNAVSMVMYLAMRAEDESVRLRAAQAIASMQREIDEHGELAERLSVLEERLNDLQRQGGNIPRNHKA